jgi:hypothetical protein
MSRMYRLTLVANDTHIPERTLRRWANQGRLTATRKGRTLYVDLLEARELADLQHAGGGRLAKPPKWPYASVESPEISAEPKAPPSPPTR